MITNNNNDFCEVICNNDEKIANIKTQLLLEDEITGLSEIFKAMGDSTRIKILHALSKEELCVCDLTEALEMTQSAISHQLRVLRNLRLVKYRKDGKMVYYSLDDDHIINLFEQGLAHIRHK